MKQLLIRHFHSVDNNVSKFGVIQLKDVLEKLKHASINRILATDHPRVVSSAKLLSEELGVKLDITELDVCNCVSLLQKSNGILFLSQQPILAEVASLISNQSYDVNNFLTGQIVEVSRL